MTLRFSVVVPAFNEEADLPRTLDSLARQDFEGDYEVIVVDNASTDATARVAERHGVRVVREPLAGVCAARQRGVLEARGEVVVSTDADTTHPTDWLRRIDARLVSRPDAVAVAGPCRYREPPWWAAVFPPLWFAAIGSLHRRTGRLGYVTATNLAFLRDGFPGYNVTLTQGGDEQDVLRRLQRCGVVLWDGGNPVTTSSRRMEQGLAHTVLVSFGYHYAFNLLLNRGAGRRVLGVAPAIRPAQAALARRRRRAWRVGLAGLTLSVLLLRRRRGR